MEFRGPIWTTKQTCPHCGQGKPVFCYCPKCSFLTLVCDETWEAFRNPLNLDEGITDICPNCGEVTTMDFEAADSDRIVNEGFTKEPYE